MATSSGSEKTLYARIGGYDALATIVDEFLQTAAADPRMERFSNAMSLDTRRRNRQLTLDYLCSAAGGPAFYLGRDLKSATPDSRSARQSGEPRWSTLSAR